MSRQSSPQNHRVDLVVSTESDNANDQAKLKGGRTEELGIHKIKSVSSSVINALEADYSPKDDNY